MVVAGCSVYTPASVDEISPRSAIRARLDPDEAARLDSFARKRVIGGTLLEVRPDSILVLVDVHSELRGNRVRTLQQRVQVARSGIVEVESRHLDRERTYLVIGLSVVGTAIFAANQIFGSENPGQPKGGSSPNEAHVPWLRFRLPWHLRIGG